MGEFSNGQSFCGSGEIWRTFPWVFRHLCPAAQVEQ